MNSDSASRRENKCRPGGSSAQTSGTKAFYDSENERWLGIKRRPFIHGRNNQGDSLQVLTTEELMAYVEAKGLQREAGGAALVRDVLRLADRNGDGVIDRREWVRAYAAINELVRDEEGATESAVGGGEIAPSRGAVAGAETGAAAGTVAGRALRKATRSISDLFQPSESGDAGTGRGSTTSSATDL